MLVATFKIQYQFAKQQYEAKVYEQDKAARNLEAVTEQIEEIENAAGDTKNYKKSDVYKNLVAYQSVYDTKKEQLKVEMDLLKGQMDGYKKAMEEGIKENTTWWCLG